MQYVLDLLLRFPPYFGSRAREHDYISKDSVEGKCRLEPESRVSSAEHAQDHRELPRVPLRGEGSCGGGGAPRDSAGSGAQAFL